MLVVWWMGVGVLTPVELLNDGDLILLIDRMLQAEDERFCPDLQGQGAC